MNFSVKSSMNRGFSSLGCPERSLREVADLGVRFGLSALELRTLSGGTDLPGQFPLGGPEVRRATEELVARGQSVCVLDTSVRVAAGPDGLAELIAFGALAEAWQVPFLRAFDGGEMSKSGTAAPWWPAGFALLHAWEEERQRRGWSTRVLIETHDSLLTAATMRQFAESAPVPVRYLWDAHHTWRKAGEPVEKTWADAADLIDHVHVKDSRRSTAAACGYELVLPGEGDFPFAEVDALLANSAYAGVICLEWERFWNPSLPPIEEALSCWQELM